jgi:hypothetical protein
MAGPEISWANLKQLRQNDRQRRPDRRQLRTKCWRCVGQPVVEGHAVLSAVSNPHREQRRGNAQAARQGMSATTSDLIARRYAPHGHDP